MTEPTVEFTTRITEPQEMFPRLPALAARLGVAPVTGDDWSGKVHLVMKDGTRYDLFELVNAFLDRMDANV